MDLIIYSLALVAYYALHSIMATTGVKAMFSKLGTSDQIYRILFNIVAISTSVGIYILFQSTHHEIDQFISPLGFAPIALGIFLIVKSLINYDLLAFIGLKKEEGGDILVTSGLNEYMRHPLYLGVILALIGWNCAYLSGAGLATLVITVLYVQIGIYLEEKKLVQQYGQVYVDYQGTVAKLVPRFWKG